MSTIVAVTTPGSEPSPDLTAVPDASRSDGLSPQEATAAVAAASQQAVEVGTRLGVLEAKLDALTAAVGALQGTMDGGLAQTSRLLAEFETALRSVGQALEDVEEQVEETTAASATPVQVESPLALPIPAAHPSRPASPLRRLLLGG